MEADQQKCNLSERKGETAAAAGGCFFCLYFLLRWSTGADAALAFHPTFPQGRCSLRVGQQKEGAGGENRKKRFLDGLKETHFLQPKCDRLTDDHAWLLHSVSDPTRRESWSQEGRRTVRTDTTGWRTERGELSLPPG